MRLLHDDYAAGAIASGAGAVYLHCSTSRNHDDTESRNIEDNDMAAIDTTRSAQFRTTPVGLGFRRLTAAIAAWNDARVTRKALSVLSDRELDDIGLTRGDIASFTARG